MSKNIKLPPPTSPSTRQVKPAIPTSQPPASPPANSDGQWSLGQASQPRIVTGQAVPDLTGNTGIVPPYILDRIGSPWSDGSPDDGDPRSQLNNNNDPSDPRIKLGLYDNLVKAGFTNPLTDVNVLAEPDAEDQLLALGFNLASEQNGQKIYVAGNAVIGGSGQRAVIGPDGKATLVTFGTPSGSGGDPFVEVISRDSNGAVSNHVNAVP